MVRRRSAESRRTGGGEEVISLPPWPHDSRNSPATRNSISRRTDRERGCLKHEDIDCTPLGADCGSLRGLFRSKCTECSRSYPSQIGPNVFYCQHWTSRPFLRGRQVGGGARQGTYARRHVR